VAIEAEERPGLFGTGGGRVGFAQTERLQNRRPPAQQIASGKPDRRTVWRGREQQPGIGLADSLSAQRPLGFGQALELIRNAMGNPLDWCPLT
jgi:hypothetical protein